MVVNDKTEMIKLTSGNCVVDVLYLKRTMPGLKMNLQSRTTSIEYLTCPYRSIKAEMTYPDHTNQIRMELRIISITAAECLHTPTLVRVALPLRLQKPTKTPQ